MADNPVNQQIALKFISALKFSASAVWNGKEALEYLLKATSPEVTPEVAKAYPIPSLILMDVQMPILDGYHATHMLRHHAPFRNIEVISQIPIVAMTASAIQGDREKCERAGMDDYMSKPVQRSLLERTVLKWIRGREVHRAPSPSSVGVDTHKPPLARACTDRSSTCTQNDAIITDFYARNAKPDTPGDDAPAIADTPTVVNGKAAARRSSISRAILEVGIPGGESEGDRVIRRADAEDKARALRDAKLLSATDLEPGQPLLPTTANVGENYAPDPPPASNPSATEQVTQTAPMALTVENVSLLNDSQDGALALPSATSPSIESEKLTYAVSDIPGPPPEETLAAIDLASVDANAEALVSSILKKAQLFPPPAQDDMASAGSLRSTKSRQELGGLCPENRQNSDWSTSTARPGKS